MAFDFKKEFKEFYQPKSKPEIIEIPSMNFLAVRGKGDPNEESGEYSKALEMLYTISYTLKMSYKGDYKITDFFQYVVPPLEGFWWQEDIKGVDLTDKSKFQWISVIRLPDFITKQDFNWAIEEATKKKKIDLSKVELVSITEGLVVQMLHVGPYDREIDTVKIMEQYMLENGYEYDFDEFRHHHEIYLSDPRKTVPEKLKTIIRHPIRKK
ncbi:MAG: transcriptional regulator [Tissierellia bacterium]|nr:transcriptional regulator [Tissierellia bacterium]